MSVTLVGRQSIVAGVNRLALVAARILAILNENAEGAVDDLSSLIARRVLEASAVGRPKQTVEIAGVARGIVEVDFSR